MNQEPILLKPGILRTISLFIVCGLFVFTGFFILDKDPVMSWLIIVFFGMGVLVFGIQLIPSSAHLKLTEEGFEIKNLFRTNFIYWEDVNQFSTGYIGKNRMVMFDFSPKHKKFESGKRIAKSLSGREGALPNNYGMKAEELAKLMNHWRTNSLN